MERRDLLKLGISAPFILTSSMARGDGGGGVDIVAKKMWLAYYDEEEKEDEKITNFYIGYGGKYYTANLAKFDLYDDADANGRPTATTTLRGARRTGQIHAYYIDGIQGGFRSGIYVAPSRVPAVNNATVLVQAFHNNMSYTLSGSIRFRAIGSRRAEKLPEQAEFQRGQRVADLYQNGNTFVLSPQRYRFGLRLTF